MTTLTEAARTYNMEVANERLSVSDQALDLIAFRVREVLNDETTCPAWCDMLNALRDILSVVKETRGGVS